MRDIEPWQHMSVTAIERQGDLGELTSIGPDGHERLVASDTATINRKLRLLTEMGGSS